MDKVLIFLPLLLTLFALFQLIRFLMQPSFTIGIVSVILFIFLFSYSFLRDVKRLRSKPQKRIYYYQQHAFKITMAFGFAVMAVLRLGIKIDIINLEYTVLIPLIIFLGFALYAENNIGFFLRNKTSSKKVLTGSN